MPFTFPDTQQPVRIVAIDGVPWFVATDVCAVLQHSNSRAAVGRLPERMKGVTEVDTPGGRQRMQIVSEPGAYRLVMRSNLEAAERFQDWLAEDVVPSIRKTGRYEVAAEPPDELELAERYVVAIKEKRAALALAAQMKDERDALAPAAHSWNVLASARGDYSVAWAAGVLARDPDIDTGRDRLFAALEKLGWTYRDRGTKRWQAYQKAIDAGRLAVKVQTRKDRDTGERVAAPPQVRVTLKGIHDLHRLLGGTGPIDRYIAETPPEDDEFGTGQIMMLELEEAS